MKSFKIEGMRSLVRINDSEGKLVAYVGGDSPQQMNQRAATIIQALNSDPITEARLKEIEAGYHRALVDVSPLLAEIRRLMGEREACAQIAESYGPSRPLTRPTRDQLIVGRYEGEQAASGAIAHLIRTRKP